MAEIDVRRDENEMVTKIWFADGGYIDVSGPDIVVVVDMMPRFFAPGDSLHIGIKKDDAQNLIKALQKYLELYGER